ncbi:hypothetical protein RFI_01024 [Reticulomyxa filosa]|uniref:Uncharacterized protein n=1 Tax=Reticulomyxa filosa TaxID=46433 RepID=X6PD52_RETFI|nr:hypothetical protein RFI_01024 [Reticulomyxa filosa]|eukprot:ETO36038.1 hypothetical protein RFI_01024 [Reticulomyxa filosa]
MQRILLFSIICAENLVLSLKHKNMCLFERSIDSIEIKLVIIFLETRRSSNKYQLVKPLSSLANDDEIMTNNANQATRSQFTQAADESENGKANKKQIIQKNQSRTENKEKELNDENICKEYKKKKSFQNSSYIVTFAKKYKNFFHSVEYFERCKNRVSLINLFIKKKIHLTTFIIDINFCEKSYILIFEHSRIFVNSLENQEKQTRQRSKRRNFFLILKIVYSKIFFLIVVGHCKTSMYLQQFSYFVGNCCCSLFGYGGCCRFKHKLHHQTKAHAVKRKSLLQQRSANKKAVGKAGQLKHRNMLLKKVLLLTSCILSLKKGYHVTANNTFERYSK